MSLHSVLVAVPLSLGVAAGVLCSVGVLRMRHPLDRLHYLGIATTLVPGLIAVAALVQDVSVVDGVKSVLVLLVLGLTSPAATHVIARAIRARDTGALEPEPGEIGGDAEAARRARRRAGR